MSYENSMFLCNTLHEVTMNKKNAMTYYMVVLNAILVTLIDSEFKCMII